MLKINETASVLMDTNVEATKASATIIVGKTLNDRVVNVLGPRLPMMVRGYATSTELGKAVLSNLVAGVLIHTMPENDKVMMAANAMIGAANLTFAESFNIQEMVNELMADIEFPEAAKA